MNASVGSQRLCFAVGILVLIVGALASVELVSLPALAQSSTSAAGVPGSPQTATGAANSKPRIFGQGEPGFISQFLSEKRIGDSMIFQAGDRIGMGTTNPQSTLQGTGVFGILGVTSSPEQFATGVLGRTGSKTGNGVVGEATAITGVNNGVFGRSASTSGIGVAGAATATTGNGTGVFGETSSTEFDAGVGGNASATTGNGFGVFGQTASPNGTGVFGLANAASGGVGVVGFVESPNAVAGQFVTHGGSGLILQGLSGSNKQQVFAIDGNGNGFLAGNLVVNGAVSKGGGSLKIDHPLDPANKTLAHFFRRESGHDEHLQRRREPGHKRTSLCHVAGLV